MVVIYGILNNNKKIIGFKILFFNDSCELIVVVIGKMVK